jgi:Bacterial TniB protein
MLIYGVSGTGKTMLLGKFQRDHMKTCEVRSGRRTIVSAELPPVPLLRSLYDTIKSNSQRKPVAVGPNDRQLCAQED